ncbi:MAG: hypothetical protein H6713_05695 [Myxococcales bacterium]|nr:hypothetical protein [Myxococcales bacterium]MCB9749485.1 hypothetical protein [Myxococcales bacterium]
MTSLTRSEPLRIAVSAVAPVDWLRRRWLRLLGPLARPLMVRRELRVALLATCAIASAATATLLIPLWILALGPIVWGIPHLLGDLRYLVIQPGFHRRAALWLAAGVPILATALGADVLFGFLGAAGAVLVSRAGAGRKLLGLVTVGALAAALAACGGARDIVFAHAHNLVAVLLWWAWRPRTTRLHWLPLALYVGVSALLLSDLALALAAGGLSRALGPLDHVYQVARLSPGLSGSLATRLVLLYAFAQTIHYVVWLVLLPDDDRARVTPPTFAGSVRGLWRDVGGAVVIVTTILCCGLAVWAVLDLMAANHGYFRMARFHGHLELAAAAALWMEARR